MLYLVKADIEKIEQMSEFVLVSGYSLATHRIRSLSTLEFTINLPLIKKSCKFNKMPSFVTLYFCTIQ